MQLLNQGTLEYLAAVFIVEFFFSCHKVDHPKTPATQLLSTPPTNYNFSSFLLISMMATLWMMTLTIIMVTVTTALEGQLNKNEPT